jgi:hypothetical protein
MIVGMPQAKECKITAQTLDDGSIQVAVKAKGITLAPCLFEKQRGHKQRAAAYVKLLEDAITRMHHMNVTVENIK